MRSEVIGASQLSNRFQIAAGAIGYPELSPLPNEPDAIGDAIALIKIPKLGVEQIIFEGNNSSVTQKGIGHMSGSAGVAESGVSILVGRRMTWGAPFNKINKLKIGDKITTATVGGIMNYKVSKINATIEDLNTKKSESVLALVTSAPEGLAYKDYIVLAEAEKAPYPPTPQNRYDGHGFRQGQNIPLSCVVYLVLLCTINFLIKPMSDCFGKIVTWSLISPVVCALMILFVKALDTALPPTL